MLFQVPLSYSLAGEGEAAELELWCIQCTHHYTDGQWHNHLGTAWLILKPTHTDHRFQLLPFPVIPERQDVPTHGACYCSWHSDHREAIQTSMSRVTGKQTAVYPTAEPSNSNRSQNNYAKRRSPEVCRV